MISLDTCRADRLSCYGAERPNTPELDRLARESVQFTDCLAHSGLTAPSHLSLLSGHFVHRHGLMHNRRGAFPPYSLASLLGDAGWRTAAFTGHGSMQRRHGVGFGFETFESWGAEEEAWPFTRNLAQVLPRGMAWLDDHRAASKRPFFLFLHAYDTHAPYWPDETWRQRYAGWYDGDFEPERLSRPEEFRERVKQGQLGEREMRYVNDLYDAELAAADEVLGEFLDALRSSGVADRSLIVFTSDHGEGLGEHERWVGHATVWDEVLRVPLLMRFPDGRWAGRRHDAVQHVDLLPTILAALAVDAPGGLQGMDLMPAIRGGAEVPDERLRLARVGERHNRVAVRFDRRWKISFQERTSGALGGLLFDLENDPGETRNLTGSVEGQRRFERIYARYLAFRRATAADDERWASQDAAPLDSADDLELLEALGYGGEDG